MIWAAPSIIPLTLDCRNGSQRLTQSESRRSRGGVHRRNWAARFPPAMTVKQAHDPNFVLLAETGLRIDEANWLTWADVDFPAPKTVGHQNR